VKTNEREGTRAYLRDCRMSAYKVRQVLDQIRGMDVDRAAETLALGDRDAAVVVGKLLASAVANAVHNDGLDAEELFVSACYADEGSTLKRWRPRARGRATRIRKRTSHVTIIVSRLPEERIARRRAKAASGAAQRSRRVASSRRNQSEETTATTTVEETTTLETPEAENTTAEVVEETTADQVEATTADQVEATTTDEVEATTTDEAGDEVAAEETEAEAATEESTDGEAAEEKGE
jgi:large subunit ribosomal protein L22